MRDVLPDVPTEEDLNLKEELRAKSNCQVQLKPEYQLQKLKTDQKRRARETGEKMRKLEEHMTLEMLKFAIDIDKKDELRPEYSEKAGCTR